MTPNPRTYLHRCLESFSDLCVQKYGVAFDLGAVERDLEHLRGGKPLNYDDVRYFESQDRWVFKNFWVLPPESFLRPTLQKLSITFRQLPENEERTVADLVHAFKSLDLASIVLRFVRPDHYGITSAPVQHLLELRRARDLAASYRGYLGNLRAIGARYGIGRVADADMALWVLHEKCYGNFADPEIKAEFEADTFFMRLRARNVVSPLADLSDARLTSALADVKPDLAAVLGCHTLEVLIRELGRAYGIVADDLAQVIAELPRYGRIDAGRKAEWERLQGIRNELFHNRRMPAPKEREALVEEVLELERDLQDVRQQHADAGEAARAATPEERA